MRRLLTIAAVTMVAAVFAPAVLAATANPFGGATTSDGILTLVSNTGDAETGNNASWVSFGDTGVTTFASLTTLSTELDVTDDDCRGGSPRFQVRVQTPSGEKNVFVYLGPTPSFVGCSPNVWVASGNLIGSTDGRFDTSQVQAGTQVSTYAQALALVGSYPVTDISLVVDSGWAFPDDEQTVRIRNVKVNHSTFYGPEDHGRDHGDDHGHGLAPGQACKHLRAEMGVEAFRAAYGTNRNHRNAFGKCVSQMARMKNDARRAAKVERIEDAADRCAERTTSGKGHGKKNKAKGHGKAKGHAKQLAKCLRHAV